MLWAKQKAAISSAIHEMILWLNKARPASDQVGYWRDTVVEVLSTDYVLEKYLMSAPWSAPQPTPLLPLDGMLPRLEQFDEQMSNALAQRRETLCYLSRLADVATLEAIDVELREQ